jgi:hypothetical protein
MHTAPRSSASSAVQAPSATSSVPLSAYDNMTSVSQRPPQSSCSGGTRSSTSSAAIARLQSELEQEKRQREASDARVKALQAQQESLIAELEKAKATSSTSNA